MKLDSETVASTRYLEIQDIMQLLFYRPINSETYSLSISPVNIDFSILSSCLFLFSNNDDMQTHQDEILLLLL